MSSNLTPSQRPDKNGKIVTRWVRPESPVSASRIPNVKVSKASGRVLLEEAVKGIAENRDYASYELGSWYDLYQQLRTLSDKTVDLYHKAIKDDVNGEAMHVLLSVLKKEDDDHTAVTLLEISKFDHGSNAAWSWKNESSFSYWNAQDVYNGFSEYKDAGIRMPEDITDASDPLVPKALALFNVTYRLWEKDTMDDNRFLNRSVKDKAFINDSNLVALIAERPDKADEIADTIDLLETVDGERIREAMDAYPSGFRSGSL